MNSQWAEQKVKCPQQNWMWIVVFVGFGNRFHPKMSFQWRSIESEKKLLSAYSLVSLPSHISYVHIRPTNMKILCSVFPMIKNSFSNYEHPFFVLALCHTICLNNSMIRLIEISHFFAAIVSHILCLIETDNIMCVG